MIPSENARTDLVKGVLARHRQTLVFGHQAGNDLERHPSAHRSLSILNLGSGATYVERMWVTWFEGKEERTSAYGHGMLLAPAGHQTLLTSADVAAWFQSFGHPPVEGRRSLDFRYTFGWEVYNPEDSGFITIRLGAGELTPTGMGFFLAAPNK